MCVGLGDGRAGVEGIVPLFHRKGLRRVVGSRVIVSPAPAVVEARVEEDAVLRPAEQICVHHRGEVRPVLVDQRGLRGLDIVGGDVVEVSPPFDPSGNTALVGATMMYEILCILAEATAKRIG